MTRDKEPERLETGDTFTLKGERYRILKSYWRWRNNTTNFAMNTKGVVAKCYCGELTLKEGDLFSFPQYLPHGGRRSQLIYMGWARYWSQHAKVVRVALGDDYKAKDVIEYTFCKFISGKRELLQCFINDNFYHDIDELEFIKAEPDARLTAVANLKGITKSHIFAYLIRVNKRALTRKELLKATAMIEGKPYLPASNVSYFSGPGNIIDKKILKVAGKKGRALAYTLGEMGNAYSEKALERLGADIGQL